MSCQFMVIIQDAVIPYSCDEVRVLADMWKKRFRSKNATDEILNSGMKDRHYEDYCKEIDEFLTQCKCHDLALKCDKCKESDHEGYFCRSNQEIFD